MKQNIVLIGGGGHCHSVIDVIEQENKYNIIGIIDEKEKIGNKVLHYDVIGSDDDLQTIFKHTQNAHITIGHLKSNHLRVKLFKIIKGIGFSLPVIVSPLAYISHYSLIEEGTIIMHHALINANAKIGKNCIINTKALIEHDATISNHCHISTAAIINGGVEVLENTFIGSNSTSKQYIQLSGFIKAGDLSK